MNNFEVGKDLSQEDRVAMAEAYRVYEILEPQERLKIPKFFIDSLLKYGDFNKVMPYENDTDFQIDKLSEKGKYIVMYMCTFE